MDSKRVTFYIDGFNFYYGIRRAKYADSSWQKCYWIDVVKLCESFLGQGQVLEKVIYFTASPLNPDKNSRQSAFLNANKLINGDKFEIVRGKYLEKHIRCPYCKGDITRPEEKKTDVNISIRMIEDCIKQATDTIALVSADSDLVPPLELIQRMYPEIAIKVYFPPSNYSNDLKDNLLHHRSRPVEMKKNQPRFYAAIMPDVVEKDGVRYTIPPKWVTQE
ncbi:MAG: NYN domain-containing protein [Salinivirgaceae bacterium]|nr:NYN domain-containing protein [Salinivirgaceae bacterium]